MYLANSLVDNSERHLCDGLTIDGYVEPVQSILLNWESQWRYDASTAILVPLEKHRERDSRHQFP